MPSSSLRLDQGHSLESITIVNQNGSLAKQFNLGYGYFGQSSNNNLRLKLQTLTEISADANAQPPFQFVYNESIVLPSKASLEKDHWGYYNNNSSGKLIPQFLENPDGSYIYYAEGANRETNEQRTLASLLTSITYPTGGRTEYEYESHRISKIGSRQATEYYDETFTSSCSTIGVNPQCDGTSEFTLTEVHAAEITISCACQGTNETADASAQITGPNVNLGGACGGTSSNSYHTYYWILEPGTYYLSADANQLGSYKSSANISVKVAMTRVRSETEPELVGGARIKRIKKFDKDNSLQRVKRYDYTYLDTATNQQYSSGVLVRKPYYSYLTTIHRTKQIEGSSGEYTTLSADCNFNNAYSDSYISLGDGTHIGYKQVTEFDGENGENGYTVYKYISADQEGDTGGMTFPFPPPDSRDNRRGRLLEKSTYSSNGDILNQTSNTYYFDNVNYHQFATNLKVGKKIVSASGVYNDLSFFTIADYDNAQEWAYLSSTITINYDQSNQQQTTNNFYYERPGNHNLLTRVEIDKSDGSIQKTTFKYPQDFVSGGNSLSNINSLVNAHVYSPVVEQQLWNVRNGNSNMISGKILDYDPLSYSPSSIWLFESNDLVTLLNGESTSGGKYLNLLSDDTLYKLRGTFSYSNGRIISQSKAQDVPHAYIWGYNNSFPIAEVANASPSDIAYTSFEDASTNLSQGNISLTGGPANVVASTLFGKFSYQISATSTINVGGLDINKKYHISYWSKDGAFSVSGSQSVQAGKTLESWTFYEHVVTGVANTTIYGAGNIDELSVHPVGSQISTYLYDPIFGVTCKTDTNHNSTFYEYDTFGRLKIVRDFDWNIIYQYGYHYSTHN